jgi:hypothetical protein
MLKAFTVQYMAYVIMHIHICLYELKACRETKLSLFETLEVNTA